MKKRVFSGIQPTGTIHVGNYLAAIRQWVDSQSKYDSIFCIVALHAITVPQDPHLLHAKIREVAGLLFAAGIDPELSAVFIQSHVTAHAELAWILNCFVPMGWLQRVTQFKEKSNRQRGEVSTGLFDYSALMAADILLYETDLVPVGEDQKQHVELTRDIAGRFNSIFGQTLKLPEPIFPEMGGRIMGLDDPMKKMSKSETNAGHSIGLLDSPDEIRAKILRATTDSRREIRFDPTRPAINNLLTIYQRFTGMGAVEIEDRFKGKGYAEFKQELAEVIIEGLKPLQSRYHMLAADHDHLDHLLEQGETHVRPVAERTLRIVKEKIGLG